MKVLAQFFNRSDGTYDWFMTLYLLLYIFLLSVFLTITFSLVFKNLGPWNNPMLFFLIHFLTTWSVMLWSEPVIIHDKDYPLITGTGLAVLIAVFLAATKTMTGDIKKIRRVRDRKLMTVLTQSKEAQTRIMPNRYFWALVIIESLLILSTHILKYI
jgi:hypothetical protein